LDQKSDLVSAMCNEIELRKNYLSSNSLSSIYFGGGTPSLLSLDELSQLLGTIKTLFSLEPKAEITLETNPDDIQPAVLKAWRQLGINRLSIGLQSFNAEELKWMNRAHTAEQSITAVKMAQDAGFDNITIDLIYGSRFQSLKDWADTLDLVVDLGVQHISAYQLTVENRTKLGHSVKNGSEPLPNEDLGATQFLYMTKRLKEAGFNHYEISNFGRPNFEAVHNSNYWKQSPYLGIGPSAHSFDTCSRQWNIRNNPQYIKSLNGGQLNFEKEELSTRDLYNEYVMTRFRTSWGCNPDEIKMRFGETIFKHFEDMRAQFKDQLVFQDQAWCLNTEARLQADGIASAFFIV
jgi:oxygen-independent coproporphyrinogen-3 oxidase